MTEYRFEFNGIGFNLGDPCVFVPLYNNQKLAMRPGDIIIDKYTKQKFVAQLPCSFNLLTFEHVQIRAPEYQIHTVLPSRLESLNHDNLRLSQENKSLKHELEKFKTASLELLNWHTECGIGHIPDDYSAERCEECRTILNLKTAVSRIGNSVASERD